MLLETVTTLLCYAHNDVAHPPDFDTFCRNTVITGCWSFAGALQFLVWDEVMSLAEAPERDKAISTHINGSTTSLANSLVPSSTRLRAPRILILSRCRTFYPSSSVPAWYTHTLNA